MPLYDFKCKECGTVSEVYMSRSDSKCSLKCRNCDSKDLVRLVCKSSFILKGGGWYKDGYSKKGGE